VGIVASVGLGAMVLLPLLDKLLGSIDLRSESWVQNLTLWVGLFGAFLASWKEKHLCIAVGEAVRSGRWKARFDVVSRAGTIGILLCLTVASAILTVGRVGVDMNEVGGWMPFWIALAPMPFAFAAMAAVTFWRRGEGWVVRSGIFAMAFLLGPAMIFLPYGGESIARVLGIASLVILAGIGMPLFAALGGVALLLFFLDGIPAASVPYAIYDISSEFFLPAVPLFALAGVVLARGGAPGRLIKLARASIGWVPGGAAVATILACAFFTAISGASGVTILALGGLLFPVLLAARHSERFSLGLLTASGSVGLLFPPSLPVFLYAVKGRVFFQELFLAGLVPGLLLLFLLAGMSVFGVKHQWKDRPRFELSEALAATRVASGDLLLVLLVLVAIFTGWLSLVQSAAFAAFGAIALEVGIHRKVRLRRGLPGVLAETAVLVGALIAVICLAFGVSEYLITVQIPDRIAGWMTTAIQSKWAFLLVLNLLLLVVGALMDIFSAIVIVVPLIVPLAEAYGVGFGHLGIIFLANLELGYLTPPVGLNLFLSSLTFDRPLLKVWRATLPFLAIFAVWVILVTYVPWLSEGVVDLVMGIING
jgi:tripartite ATP-independent transporter DctM subunit